MKTTNVISANMKKDGILLAIASIGRRGAVLDKDIQATALAVAAHIVDHREVTLAVKLYNAMPNGSRKLALIHWMVKFSAVKVNLDKTTKGDFPLLFNKEATIDLELAAKTAWYDCKKEKDLAEEFNPQKELEAFQKKVASWVKSGKIHADAVAEILKVTVKVQAKEETLGDVAGE